MSIVDPDIATRDLEINRLSAWVNDLQSGMYINCVYCGHRYGPQDQVPTTMAEARADDLEKQCR